jgi:hypothetical protein
MALDLQRPRLIEMSRRLAATIPCNPDIPVVRHELAAMPLPELMIAYINWVSRFVPPRPREVTFAPGFWRSDRAQRHGGVVLELVGKIRRGEELTPYLSDLVRTHGYAPRRFDKHGRSRGPEWGDKDFALNAYEAHHLHLGTTLQADGLINRTDELLYVIFGRTGAVLLMVGDHKSFDDGTLAEAAAAWHAASGREVKGILPGKPGLSSLERNRLARRGVSTFASVGDQLVLGPLISTSGHHLYAVRHADQIMEAIATVEPELDNPGYVSRLFGARAGLFKASPDFQWHLDYTDLVLLEGFTRTLGCLAHGRL